jgi:orotidine 5'-phosphate decarboxylase subfamily 1
MQPEDVWGNRWLECTLTMAKRYMTVAWEKQSLVCLAADRNTMSGLFELLEQVGPHIAALKTHVDLIDDWSAEGWAKFCATAEEHNLLIFEDRKFADIGKISRSQMAGIYDIRSWSNIVTAHLISGPDIVDGLQAAWHDVGRDGGVLLLAQMSSRGNLLTTDYRDSVVAKGAASAGVLGFIGNGSRPEELEELRNKVGDGKMIWTPGVNIAIGDGEMGQRYGDPREAVLAGSDCIIVGSGIHRSDNPAAMAKQYAEASWNALLER